VRRKLVSSRPAKFGSGARGSGLVSGTFSWREGRGVEASEEFVGVVRLGVKLEREEIRSSSIIIRREVSEESQDAQ
jgi:hypothetical protein